MNQSILLMKIDEHLESFSEFQVKRKGSVTLLLPPLSVHGAGKNNTGICNLP